MMVSTAEVRRPRLMGAMARAVLGRGPDHEDPDDRRQDADGRHDQREDQADLGPWPRPEGGVGQDQGGHQDDDVGLEQVGAHAGAVAHVVAHVVGDGGGVAGVVLGDAGLDLADQVGAHVGGLGEDAAPDSHEQGQQRPTEAEADQDGGGGVLGQHDDDGGAEQAEADHEHAGDGAGAERHLAAPAASDPSRAAAAVRTLPRTAVLMPMNPARPDRMAPTRKARARNRPDSP